MQMRHFLASAVLLALFASPAESATYYVATTGSNSNDGSAESPWRYPQKCAGPPVAAGDTCIVRSGTYSLTGSGNTFVVIRISSSVGSAAGTSLAPITIKSETPLGAVIQVPSVAGSQSIAISVSRPYYVIEGFDVDGSATTYQTSSTHFGHAGIAVYAPNVVVRRNKIHHIARTQCSNSPYGNAATYTVQGFSNVTFEYNLIYSIGRLRNGESGCSTDKFQHDHGFYGNWGTGLIFRYNVIYDTNRGYPMNIHTADGVEHTHSGYKIYNNTFGGEAPQTSSPHGQIVMGGKWVNSEFKNNVFLDTSPAGVIQSALFLSTAAHSGNVVSYNRTNVNTTGTDPIFVNAVPTGFTSSNNSRNVTLGLVNASCTGTGGSCTATDFTLASSSALINAGTAMGDAYCESAPDIGAFETCGPLSATISGQSIDVTFGTVHVPLQVVSGVFSVSCIGTGCGTPVVSNLSVLQPGANVIRATVTGITGTNCAVGQTWTVSLNTAVIKDSIDVGYTYDQLVHTFTSFPVTNNCSGSPPSPPAGPHVIYEMDENTGTTLTNTGSGGAGLNGTLQGSPTWVSGVTGYGVSLTPSSAQYVTVGYGNAVNPSTQSLTVSFWFNVDAASVGLNRSLYGSSSGTDQRNYITILDGTYRVGIQASSETVAAGDIAVTAGLHHACLVFDSTVDQATLHIDGVASTGAGAKKSYTSYTFASNFAVGRINDSATGVGGMIDRLYIYQSVESCSSIYNAQRPASVAVGTFTLQTHRTEAAFLLPGGVVDIRTTNGSDAFCVAPGAIALHIQIKCDAGTSCDSTSFPLYYSTDGVTYDKVVGDTPSSDGVYFYGPAAAGDLNRFDADGPLSAGLTHVDGPTTVASAAQSQSYTLAQNTSLTLRYLLSFTTAAQGKTFRFRPKRGNGLSLDTYTTTPRIDLVTMRASGG